MNTEALDPRIGIAMRNGVEHYYVHVDGKFPVRKTVGEAMAILEGRAPPDGPEAGKVYDEPAPVAVKAQRAARQSEDRDFEARLTDPSGYVSTYRVTAKNKTEARREIGRLFRLDVPAPRYGFYSFDSCRFEWVDNDE